MYSSAHTLDHTDPTIVRERMAAALAATLSPGLALPAYAQPYMGWKPSDMVQDLLQRRGIDTRRLSKDAIVNAATHTTSDYPELLGSTANKVFLGSYNAAPTTYRAIAAQVDLTNFQVHNLLRDGDFPSLQQVPEAGEFARGTMSESKELAQLATFGRTFSISRHALINDSLGVFGRTVAKIGTAVARFENKQVWAIVTGNPTLSETTRALFNTTDGSLAGSSDAISATSLGAGRAAMRKQKSLDGETLNIAPSVLAVPAAKETVAEQVLSPLVVPEASGNVTPSSMRSLNIVTEALLDANSGTAWYLFANPTVSGANIVYGYSDQRSVQR